MTRRPLPVISLSLLIGVLWLISASAALSRGEKKPAPRRKPATAHRHRPAPRLGPDPLAKGSKVALGVTTSGTPGPALTDFSRLVGERPRIVMWYQPWSQPLYYRPQIQATAAVGAAPMITWDPTLNGVGIPLSTIAAGGEDRYIRRSAIVARRLKRRIYIRFAHEMNLSSSPFGPEHDGNTPATFIRAWRRVVDIFRQERASNAEFVWSPNVDCNGKCPFTRYYPGNGWVGWVALDGYNYAGVDHDPWISFARVFQASYWTLVHLTKKPVMIGETASAPQGGDKAQWIRGIGSTLQHHFRRERVLIWFQRVKETDWRVNSSSASLAAFRALVNSPLFQGLSIIKQAHGLLSTTRTDAANPIVQSGEAVRRSDLHEASHGPPGAAARPDDTQ